jgi:asparagine synthase (glutamine-hydrolysing)
VSRFCRQSSVVALTGDGGDEVFGGYKWYESYPVRRRARLPGARLLQPGVSEAKNWKGPLGRAFGRLEWSLLDDLPLYVKNLRGLLRSDKRAYARRWSIDPDYDDYWHLRRYWREDLPLMTRMQFLDFHTILPDKFLTKVDRVSMSAFRWPRTSVVPGALRKGFSGSRTASSYRARSSSVARKALACRADSGRAHSPRGSRSRRKCSADCIRTR